MQKTRPPVVTLMGHVDHGKTTLLTTIRKTRLPRESGGITQHIGAYQVRAKDGRSLTFIDTPGHAAFEKMRSRGASVADIVVLVVAADDGVKPQTVEAIKHIKTAGVPMIVAINKIDLPGVNLDKVKQQLAEKEVLVEGYGGDVVVATVSATKGTGIDGLLEMILLVADMQELRADPDGAFRGVVIESRMDSRRGPVATLLVQEGTLTTGDRLSAGQFHGNVRNLFDEDGKRVETAGPSTPVEILGLNGVPPVGTIVTRGKAPHEQKKVEQKKQSVEEKLRALDKKTVRFIIKADVSGSLEAVSASLGKLGEKEREIEILSEGTGVISESDVMFAQTAHAKILGFRTKASGSVKKLAESSGVTIKTYDVIYELLEDVKKILAGKDDTETPREGCGEIVRVFAGTNPIAGTKVTEGTLRVGGRVEVIRGTQRIGAARIVSMRHKKEKITSCTAPGECGIVFDPPLDFQEGDAIQSR